MKEVILNKFELLKHLRSNRSQHKADYDKSMVGWRQQVNTWFNEQLAAMVDAGDDPELNCPHPKPLEYLKEYDREIKMCDMGLSTEIELTAHEFSMYVMDEWEWTERFTASNVRYR